MKAMREPTLDISLGIRPIAAKTRWVRRIRSYRSACRRVARTVRDLK